MSLFPVLPALLILLPFPVFSDLPSPLPTGKTILPPPSSSTGETETVDMSLSSLSADLCALLKVMFPSREEAPSLLLVGHSMVRSFFRLLPPFPSFFLLWIGELICVMAQARRVAQS